MADITVQATVDRIEGDRAVLLLAGPDGEIAVNWPKAVLPSGVGEGSKLDITLHEDRQEEEAARERVASLLEQLTKERRYPED